MKGMPGFGIQMSYVQMRRGLPLAPGHLHCPCPESIDALIAGTK